MDSFKNSFGRISEYVGRMSPSQVMMLLGVTTGSIVGIIFMVGWLNSVTYTRLYSGLDEAEAGEVISYLNDNKIAYQLSDGGRTIEVPSDQVYQARISLASQGLPRGGSVGYSIFDQNNLGMTDFLQNLNFRRALEGELTRTIMQLSEVLAARVHIVIPRDRLFEADQQKATASVVLKLSGGGLAKHQVKGITHLVASSVEGLTPDNITIVDYDGNLLSSGETADLAAGLSSTQLDVRKQVEQYLEQKAQTMMDGVLGDGKSIVRVTADLDFQQLERTSEIYDPNSSSIRSEETTKASSKAQDKASEDAESNQDDATETTVTNYELNKTVEHIINAVGTIKRLSVAVMVDGVYEDMVADDGTTESVYQPRSQDELDRLASIIRNAIGYDQQRNDQIEMVNLAFDQQNLQQDRDLLDSMYMREFYMDIGKKVGIVLLILFLLFYMKKKAGKLFAALGRLIPPPTRSPSSKGLDEAIQPVAGDSDPAEPLPQREVKLVDRMRETAKKEPDEIAKVIKTMMFE